MAGISYIYIQYPRENLLSPTGNNNKHCQIIIRPNVSSKEDLLLVANGRLKQKYLALPKFTDTVLVSATPYKEHRSHPSIFTRKMKKLKTNDFSWIHQRIKAVKQTIRRASPLHGLYLQGNLPGSQDEDQGKIPS